MTEQEKNKGLDDWNNRLDKNLESEKHGDEIADLRAEDFSDENGSGDQSDDPNREISTHEPEELEDNMAKNHPHPASREENLGREE